MTINEIITKIENTYNCIQIEDRPNVKIRADRLDESSPNKKIGHIVLSKSKLESYYLSEEFYAFAILHEVGHFLGGCPRMASPKWMSSEPQADYWAAIIGMKEFYGAGNYKSKIDNAADELFTHCMSVSDPNNYIIDESAYGSFFGPNNTSHPPPACRKYGIKSAVDLEVEKPDNCDIGRKTNFHDCLNIGEKCK